MKICACGSVIQQTKVIDGKRRNLRNRTKCLDCLPFGQSQYRKKTDDEIRSSNAEKARKHYHNRKAKLGKDPIRIPRETRKLRLVDLIGGKCQICGYHRTIRNLGFHHLRDKKFPLSSRGFQYSWDDIVLEAKKCAMVCHNCHGEIHDGLIDHEVIEACNLHVIKVLC